jgi:sec-independent protein translocase protein TatA
LWSMVGDILQPTHLLFILVVALLVLGPKRLPEVGRTLGSGLRDFRQAINGESNSHDEPRNYVESESELEPDIDTGPAFADEQPATAAVDEHEVAHEPSWTPAPEADTGPAFTGDHGDVEAGTDTAAASDEHEPAQAAEPAPRQSAAGSSTGFASALAASRRQPGDDSGDDQ